MKIKNSRPLSVWFWWALIFWLNFFKIIFEHFSSNATLCGMLDQNSCWRPALGGLLIQTLMLWDSQRSSLRASMLLAYADSNGQRRNHCGFLATLGQLNGALYAIAIFIHAKHRLASWRLNIIPFKTYFQPAWLAVQFEFCVENSKWTASWISSSIEGWVAVCRASWRSKTLLLE